MTYICGALDGKRQLLDWYDAQRIFLAGYGKRVKKKTAKP
jgi:hypothetical protein